MQNFIVLGIVPGTNFQLNLDSWLVLALSVCVWLNAFRLLVLAYSLYEYGLVLAIALRLRLFDVTTLRSRLHQIPA